MKNILAFITKFRAKKAQIDKLTEEYESMKKELSDYIKGTCEKDESGKITYVCGQYTVIITTCKRTDIDKKKLSALYPEIMEECKTESIYERVTTR